MATISAYESINMDNINFYRLNTGWPEYEYYDNQPMNMVNVPYNDTFSVYWNYGDNFADFGGSNIVADPWSGTMTGGTVQGIAEGYYSYWDYGYWYSYTIHGISVSAVAIENAISTPSLSDDQALIQSALSGADTFSLSDGDDLARGYAGNDVMRGNDGYDKLYGGKGNDKLKGGLGNDNHLDGEEGRDTLSGGKGNDTFVFMSPKEDGDKITDFHNKQGDNDRIKIDASSYRGGLDTGKLDASEFQVSSNNRAEDRDVRFIFRTTDETLWFDKNGSKSGGLSLVADLQGSADLTHHDILLI